MTEPNFLASLHPDDVFVIRGLLSDSYMPDDEREDLIFQTIRDRSVYAEYLNWRKNENEISAVLREQLGSDQSALSGVNNSALLRIAKQMDDIATSFDFRMNQFDQKWKHIIDRLYVMETYQAANQRITRDLLGNATTLKMELSSTSKALEEKLNILNEKIKDMNEEIREITRDIKNQAANVEDSIDECFSHHFELSMRTEMDRTWEHINTFEEHEKKIRPLFLLDNSIQAISTIFRKKVDAMKVFLRTTPSEKFFGEGKQVKYIPKGREKPFSYWTGRIEKVENKTLELKLFTWSNVVLDNEPRNGWTWRSLDGDSIEGSLESGKNCIFCFEGNRLVQKMFVGRSLTEFHYERVSS